MKELLIDSGTTNSRIRLFDRELNRIIDLEKIKVGVRNTAIDGSNKGLIERLNKGIQTILTRNQLVPKDVAFIVASGMITSNLGVYEVPHIAGPADLEEFARHSVVERMDSLLQIPCVFIPGMKNSVGASDDVDSINELDVMRGEEVESFGLLRQIEVTGKGIIILPGSHTKFVIADAENMTLSSCLSTLGGETLFAIQRETILSDSLKGGLIEEIDKEMLEKGFEAARKFGLTRSLYHIRLLQLFTDFTANQRANYFTGSVIYSDLKALSKTVGEEEINWVIIGGSEPLKSVFTHLLTKLNHAWSIVKATEKQAEYSLVYGADEIALKVFENTKGQKKIK